MNVHLGFFENSPLLPCGMRKKVLTGTGNSSKVMRYRIAGTIGGTK
jgi:hypothetical protein